MTPTNHRCKGLFVIAVVAIIVFCANIKAEDGYRLWLRYDLLPRANVTSYRARLKSVLVPGDSPTIAAARAELANGYRGLLGTAMPLANKLESDGLILGTPQTSTGIAALHLDQQLAAVGSEGFIIRSVRIENHAVIVIASNGEIGVLYGAFRFLRLLQTLQPIDQLNISERPRLQLRVLDHWDNLDGSIERGYAGKSLWNWQALPAELDARLIVYARANSSIG